MASEELKGENPQPQTLNYKTWVLRVSVHCICEGCKKKVKKIISQVPGVHSVDIDIRQQRAIVIGNVEADTLIKKLLKSGKNAELWPEQPMQKEKKLPGKSKPKEKQPQQHHQESQKNQENTKVKMHKPSGEKKEANPPPVKIEALKQPTTKKSKEKIDDFDVDVRQKSKENNDGASDATIKAVESNSKDSPGDHQEKDQSKSKGKKVEGCSVTSQPLAKAEKSGGGGDHNCDGEVNVGDCGGGSGGDGGGGSGKNVKKKKNKGQNGKSMSKAGGASPSSSCANKPANMESGNPDNGAPPNSLMPANQSPPRHYGHHHYPPHGPHHYGPLPSPSYGLSYNTSYPTSSYTTSYYAPSPPANGYAYSHPGPESHPPPPPPMSDPDSYPSQFEIFSDENPNGCLVM